MAALSDLVDKSNQIAEFLTQTIRVKFPNHKGTNERTLYDITDLDPTDIAFWVHIGITPFDTTVQIDVNIRNDLLFWWSFEYNDPTMLNNLDKVLETLIINRSMPTILPYMVITDGLSNDKAATMLEWWASKTLIETYEEYTKVINLTLRNAQR